MFFVGTSAPGKSVNVSPKGVTPLKVLGKNKAAYIDFAGSGNRTAEDIAEGSTVTVMFCSFSAEPLILRLFCNGEAVTPSDAKFAELSLLWPDVPGKHVRTIFMLDIFKVQTSCGYGVPVFEYIGLKPTVSGLVGKG